MRRGSADLHKQLAGIDKVLADAVSTSPVAALLADDTQTLTERWAAASADISGKVVNELMIGTVMPARRGSRIFDPSTVEIHWR